VFKRFLRWPSFLLLAALVLAALIPIIRAGHYGIAHATGNTPQITVTGNVTKGQALQLQVQGFAASEQLQLSWNGNGGQFLGMLDTDANGTATNCATSANCIVAPSVLASTYTITAIGSTSGSQASTSIIVNVSTIVTPQNAGPGSTIQVIGSGFPTNANLTIYFQSPTNGTSATLTDNSGSFIQSLTLPKTYNPQTPYNVYVSNAQNAVLATLPFAFQAVSITPSLTKVTPGATVTICGKGFLANEAVSLSATIAKFLPFSLGKVHADAAGNFTQTLTAPNIFNTLAITLQATGSTSNLQATTHITVVGASGPKIPVTRKFAAFPHFRKH
jgi:hypothetical protein